MAFFTLGLRSASDGYPTVKYWMSIMRKYRHPIGQYYFWKLSACEKRDIDAVVNAMCFFFVFKSGRGENTEAVC